MEQIRNFNSDRFSEFSAKLMSDMNIVENIVLKAHVISEFAINCYLESISNTGNMNLFKKHFTYANKLFLLEEFGKLPVDKSQKIIHSYKLLNKLRNEFAHKLQFNEFVFKDPLKSIKSLNPELFHEKDTGNKDDILKYLENDSFILSYLNGFVFGLYQSVRDSDQ